MLAAFALSRTVEDHSDGINYGLKKGERGRRKRENKKEKKETQQGRKGKRGGEGGKKLAFCFLLSRGKSSEDHFFWGWVGGWGALPAHQPL